MYTHHRDIIVIIRTQGAPPTWAARAAPPRGPGEPGGQDAE